MIYLLMIVVVQIQGNDRNINVDALPFETKTRCERNLENVKDQLLKQGYDAVHVECQEKVISKGK